jgi:hypothetical protein
MNRTKINYLVNIPLLIQSLIVSLSGVLLLYGGRHITLMGLDGREWLYLHEQIGILMVAFSVLHIALHWKWMICTTRNFVHSGKNKALSKCGSDRGTEV